jgi:hypothetical protein
VTAVADRVFVDDLAEWRFQALKDAGYGYDHARTLALAHSGPHSVDLHAACDLITERGCDPATAFEIMRPSA